MGGGAAPSGVPALVRKWRARKDLEPPTPKFVVWCSIQLSYGRAVSCLSSPTAGAGLAANRDVSC